MHYVPLGFIERRTVANGGGERYYVRPPVIQVSPTAPAPILEPTPFDYGGVIPPPIAPSNDTQYGTGLTREQLMEMIARSREFEAGQYTEDGNGYAYDLESQAGVDEATRQAIDDAAGMQVPGADERRNWIPLAVAAGLIYFMSG